MLETYVITHATLHFKSMPEFGVIELTFPVAIFLTMTLNRGGNITVNSVFCFKAHILGLQDVRLRLYFLLHFIVRR